MENLTIVHLTALPSDIMNLVSASENEGYRFVRRLMEEWLSGANQFNKPGEALFGAHVAQSLVGICGVNQDSYVDTAEIARLRHLYVQPELRGNGVGRLLVSGCIKSASVHFNKMRLRTSDDQLHAFYRHMSFRKVNDVTATHELML